MRFGGIIRIGNNY